ATGEKQLYLFDEENLNIIDMSQASSYSFTLSSSTRFKIYYGKDALSAITSEKIQISEVFPNPVADDNRMQFKIALPSTTNQYSASVQVFNLQGVALQKFDKKLSGGIQQIEIELNSILPSGTYLYQVIVSSGKSQELRTGKIIKK
nr:T9SS type A sorting domain-containing protein [Cyclobacteriaceae bacterium]